MWPTIPLPPLRLYNILPPLPEPPSRLSGILQSTLPRHPWPPQGLQCSPIHPQKHIKTQKKVSAAWAKLFKLYYIMLFQIKQEDHIVIQIQQEDYILLQFHRKDYIRPFQIQQEDYIMLQMKQEDDIMLKDDYTMHNEDYIMVYSVRPDATRGLYNAPNSKGLYNVTLTIFSKPNRRTILYNSVRQTWLCHMGFLRHCVKMTRSA